MELLIPILLFILAGVPAMIAAEKGRSPIVWYFLGLLLFVPAFIFALRLEPTPQVLQKRQAKLRERSEADGARRCPGCGEFMRADIAVCGLCGSDMSPNPA
jgi:uncharacterized membrane protein YqaE (UPF0057 family)